jgi:hypothetical protein
MKIIRKYRKVFENYFAQKIILTLFLKNTLLKLLKLNMHLNIKEYGYG